MGKLAHDTVMTDKKSESYYEINREKRLAYQKEYYKLRAGTIKRKRELDIVLNPEKVDARKAYNRSYFLNNRASIMEKRAARKNKATKQQ